MMWYHGMAWSTGRLAVPGYFVWRHHLAGAPSSVKMLRTFAPDTHGPATDTTPHGRQPRQRANQFAKTARSI